MSQSWPKQILAPAKVNLTLHVTGRRADGYHTLDSVVMFADMGDKITLTPADGMSIYVAGPFQQGVPTDARNLIWQAAEMCDWSGHVQLTKTLPHAAGIGGGSSDAAAVLKALSVQKDANTMALGADVPVCLRGRASRMRGVGEDLMDLTIPDTPVLLVNPGALVPTGAVFGQLETPDNAPMPDALPAFSTVEQFASWLSEQRNDLERPASHIAPVIGDALDALSDTKDALLARMSGSGATCFAMYPTLKAAQFAAYELEAAHPDWWVVATTLR